MDTHFEYKNVFQVEKVKADKRVFGVKKYKLIHRNQILEYINAVKDYTPPIGIQSEIDSENSQMKLDL